MIRASRDRAAPNRIPLVNCDFLFFMVGWMFWKSSLPETACDASSVATLAYVSCGCCYDPGLVVDAAWVRPVGDAAMVQDKGTCLIRSEVAYALVRSGSVTSMVQISYSDSSDTPG